MEDSNKQYFEKGDTSVIDWLITLILVSIPILNIIMLCVWAFTSSTAKPSRRNWSRALLIIFFFVSIFSLIFFLIFGSVHVNNMLNTSPASEEVEAFHFQNPLIRDC